MHICQNEDCDNIPYSNPEYGIYDKICTPCALLMYYSDKPVGFDFGD